MKKLLAITLLFLSSTIYSQSILSWFNPVEEYSCSCVYIAYEFGEKSCNGKSALVFQEGRRLEFSWATTVGKVELLNEPSEWYVKKELGGWLVFDSITKRLLSYNSDSSSIKFNCTKVN